MGTRAPRAVTRKRVLSAAADAFAAGGIDGTSLADIAARAGLTKGAIYSNFESKDDLVLALVDEYNQPIDVSTFLEQDLNFEGQLRELGRAAARAMRGANKRQVLLDRALQTHLLRRPTVLARYRRRMRTVAETGGAWVEALADDRGVSLPMPGPRLVAVLMALVRGLIESALQDPALADEEHFADAFALLAPALQSSSPRHRRKPR